MNWEIHYSDEAKTDLRDLDGSQRKSVLKAIKKVSQNPLPVNEGGYGKPLGNKHGKDLTGLCKIKLMKEGIRVVYALIRKDSASGFKLGQQFGNNPIGKDRLMLADAVCASYGCNVF